MTVITSRRTVMIVLFFLLGCFLYISILEKPAELAGGNPEDTPVEAAPPVEETLELLPEKEPDYLEEQPAGEEFFMEYRLERDRRRAQEIELLQSLFNSADETGDIKREVQYKLLEISNSIDQELALETLIIAKGYADAVAVVQPDSVTVVVQSGDFSEEDAALIADLITRTTGISLSKITVFAKE